MGFPTKEVRNAQVKSRRIRFFALYSFGPNPCNARAHVRYVLPRKSEVTLEIYDAAGKRVRTLEKSSRAAAWYRAAWDGKTNLGSDVSAGVYFCRMAAGNFAAVQKLVILK